jgi:hypothetical protein
VVGFALLLDLNNPKPSAAEDSAPPSIRLFPDTGFEKQWFDDPGAVSFGLPASPHSPSLSYLERPSFGYLSRLVLLPRTAPFLSGLDRIWSIQQYDLAILKTRPALALAGGTDEANTDTGLELEISAILFR